ncbi:putative leucine-rich repeat receptor-like protein kinase [Dorcoceras hygrometricum]|uniref:Putative leucine-rich repeat receptor-like protein kinase n=1 Tax=Dorcoceras hygrometricum TaxID=472368 RepID=A0A2Z7B1C7_9LAMI|nr:putative leucine-rich repeat receptor-like protein kinase [Dorcoceras hygrometricum]
MQAALSKLETENAELRSRSEEMLYDNQRLAGIISYCTRSSASLHKLHGATNPSGDRTRLGYNSDEGSTAETSSTPRLEKKKFKIMNIVKSSAKQATKAPRSGRVDIMGWGTLLLRSLGRAGYTKE